MPTVFDNYFPLGLGTSRFPISGPDDAAGIEKSLELVTHALDAGVNYIDTAYTYSAGMAQTVLKEAFAQTKKPFGVTVKVMHDMDKTADEARRRVELQLKTMGLTRTAFFTCWFVNGYSQFESIMSKDGVYEGALKLKAEGIIDHICFSAHAPNEDVVRIIASGAFEGVTLSYSLINATSMRKVLDAAQQHNVGVAVMNPLGGGIIAQNPDFFSFARSGYDNSTIDASLRFVKSHPAVKIILSGVSSTAEFDENIKSITEDSAEPDVQRYERVFKRVGKLPEFCTGCNYCKGCPVNIPISEIMSKRNKLLFAAKEAYNRTEPELVANIRMFYAHISAGASDWLPEDTVNPCIQCGQCEEKCTQKLKIIDSVEDTYARASAVGYSLNARKERLRELLVGKNYKTVGIYPNGGFADTIVKLYGQFWGEPDFAWLQFNSDPKMWGEMSGGLSVCSPDDILKLRPDIIIVGTYKYDSEIYGNLRHYEDEGINIVKLHRDTDVPWVF
jgi:predicted aldo/keto reductase-like oxidoreductase